MKIRKAAAGMLIGVWVLSGCVGRADDPDEAAKTQQTTSDGETDQDPAALNAKQLAKLAGDYSDKAQKAEWSMESATVLNLSDGGVLIEGDGVKENAGVLTITKKGTYVLQGSMENGRIEVDADEQNVTLVLNNVSIASETSAPICIKEAKNVYLIPADGSKNRILDRRASADSSEDDDTEEETAAIYSKDDLVLCGTGSLYVEGGYKDGIKGKDELQILNVSLTVKANDDGMIGNDSVCIKDASVTIEAGDDGIKATEETDQGYVVIDSGNIAITAKNKGIDAVNALVIRDGDVEIDASEEGMESRYILINDGEVRILAGDDGINISDGSGSKAAVPGDGSLIINGGTVTVDSQGDGIDSNGNVQINGGYTIVSGTMTGGNAALDYDGDCEINGGVLLLTSFGDMETGVGAASKQRMASITLSEALAAGTSIEISDKDGEVLYTFRNAKQCRYIAVCSPEVTEESVIHITAAGQIQTAVVR